MSDKKKKTIKFDITTTCRPQHFLPHKIINVSASSGSKITYHYPIRKRAFRHLSIHVLSRSFHKQGNFLIIILVCLYSAEASVREKTLRCFQGAEVIKKSMLNSGEHEILNAHKYKKNIKKFRFFQAQIIL